MKRLAAVAVMVAWFCWEASAQRGGSHGGFSGSHAGFSAPAGGFAGRGGPVFRGGFDGGFSGPRGGFHNRVFFPNRFPFRGYRYGWGYPLAWGYPYFWPGILGDWDDLDLQQTENYPPPPPWYYGPYQYQPPPDQYRPQPNQYQPPPPEDQDDPAPSEQYLQPSSSSRRAPHKGAQNSPPAPGAVTLVFKDGRPSEYVYDYVMTPKTLTVLDEPRRVIPLNRIDLEASAIASAEDGVEFSGPVPSP
jgi:hypothetical protein